jgi:hypothetical protein
MNVYPPGNEWVSAPLDDGLPIPEYQWRNENCRAGQSPDRPARRYFTPHQTGGSYRGKLAAIEHSLHRCS